MLERSYTSVGPYTQNVKQQVDSALEAQSYQQLVSAVLYLVTQHSEEGIIRLYNYTGEVEGDVSRACLEVVQRDPLGAFAVDYIKHDVTRVVSFYEAKITIAYRRTAEEMDQVTAVTGSSAIKRELGDTLFRFEDSKLLRISYYSEATDYLQSLARQAYYDFPLAALGMPEVSITLYPESGVQRIVEIHLTYSDTLDHLLAQQDALTQAASNLLSSSAQQNARSLYDLLRHHTGADSTAGSTAYAALVEGTANAEGFALAYKLLCDQAGLTCTVVQGEGKHSFWNIVSTPAGSRHVDCVNGLFGLTDLQIAQMEGYVWSDSYPICRDGSTVSVSS